MGCCCSKNQLKGVNNQEAQALSTAGTVHGAVHTLSPAIREPTVSEKRARAAQAAENRQADWRQGGSKDAEKTQALKLRREKDELLGKIYHKYQALGKEAPIGLPSCDNEQLRRHLATLK